MLLLAALLAAGALPSQQELEVALADAAAAACPHQKIRTDADLRRGCRNYVDAAARGRVQASTNAASFFGSLESYEPALMASVATVSPPGNADRAVGQLVSSCGFNRAGVAAAVLPSGE